MLAIEDDLLYAKRFVNDWSKFFWWFRKPPPTGKKRGDDHKKPRWNWNGRHRCKQGDAAHYDREDGTRNKIGDDVGALLSEELSHVIPSE